MIQTLYHAPTIDPPRDRARDSTDGDDRSWYNSSFELAQGLEVVEVLGDFRALAAWAQAVSPKA